MTQTPTMIAIVMGSPSVASLHGAATRRLRPGNRSQVSGGLAAFSGVYFAVAMLTDLTHRATA
jgi:hypothetical protein